MITIALCDDDISYLKSILHRSVLEAVYKADIQAEIRLFSNGIKLLKEYESGNRFDIVILDIGMPFINGKELAARLRSMDHSFFLVFVTSYRNEIANTIRYRINAFIPKSSDKNEMNAELIRVFKEYSQLKPQYEVFEILRCGMLSTFKVPLNDILGFYLEDNIIYLKTTTGDYILKERIFSEILKRFLGKNFIECRRNYIININRISEIDGDIVILENGEIFPVSKRNYNKLVKAFIRHIMEEADN